MIPIKSYCSGGYAHVYIFQDYNLFLVTVPTNPLFESHQAGTVPMMSSLYTNCVGQQSSISTWFEGFWSYRNVFEKPNLDVPDL